MSLLSLSLLYSNAAVSGKCFVSCGSIALRPHMSLWMSLLSSAVYELLHRNDDALHLERLAASSFMPTSTIRINSFPPPPGQIRLCGPCTHRLELPGKYLPQEDIGQKADIEPITFQTKDGGTGVRLTDVLHGIAVIESPNNMFEVVEDHKTVSWTVRVSTVISLFLDIC
jgi:hypothetical protein